MARVRIKICGITRREDALAAAALGVDAIGLVFCTASPRAVNIAQARQIVELLPPFLSKVGLFVDADEHYVRRVVAEVSLDVLQFHGEESATACRRYAMPYIKAIKMREAVDLHQGIKIYHDAAGILLDTYCATRAGGSGKVFDWDRVPADLGKPVILAGGLGPANVATAIKQVRPYAVDVSGGVEAGSGIKSRSKMQAFIREVGHAQS